MDSNKNDYEHMLFYFAYKTFIKTADEIIEKYDMSRRTIAFCSSLINCLVLPLHY